MLKNLRTMLAILEVGIDIKRSVTHIDGLYLYTMSW